MNNKVLLVTVAVLLIAGVLFIRMSKPTETGITPEAQQENAEKAPVPLSEDSITNEVTQGTSTTSDQIIGTASSSSIPPVTTHTTEKLALLADGCFWCVEHDLEEVTGVSKVVSGYAGGVGDNPTYENYVGLGYKEVVLVTYDPSKVTYGNLVEHIIKHGDPTDASGSFHDRGLQYAPAIYYENDAEKTEARRVIDAVDTLKVFPDPLPIAILPTTKFWPAEEYHQDFSKKNPLKYGYYRTGSGRTAFIEKTWGERASKFEVPSGVTDNTQNKNVPVYTAHSWDDFIKPGAEKLQSILTPLQYKVTQEAGTEPPHNNVYDKNYEEGIYVDIVSGEPLYFSKDKYDSGTGWPSFVKPISDAVVVLKEDNGFFTKRTEVRSRYADSHIGHVFDDGPVDRGGKRYCMNSAALRFIAKADMEKEGYGYLLSQIQ